MYRKNNYCRFKVALKGLSVSSALFKWLALFMAMIAVHSFMGCTSQSLRKEMNSLKGLFKSEAILLMGGQPDEIITDRKGREILIYRVQYVRMIAGDPRYSTKTRKIYLNKEGKVYKWRALRR